MNDIVRLSRQTLSKHARSFRWAAFFLAPDQRDDAAILYTICRVIDDMADEAPDADVARAKLAGLRRMLAGEKDALVDEQTGRVVAAFLDMAQRRGLDVQGLYELIEGVESDLGRVIFQSDEDLLRYSYRVAGVVGLLMCPILGVKDPKAMAHAIDLGVGMQLTNICRDVVEDAARGRVYLPAERLRRVGITSESVLNGTADNAALKSVIVDVLELAERYYESAQIGMKFIPARSRFAILVASRLYRGIGLKVLRGNADPTKGRVWVSLPGKIAWICSAVVSFVQPAHEAESHDQRLHAPLRGLPGVH